jgi:hypothetical protein
VNVSTGEWFECLSNPTEVVEKLAVNWNRLAVPGLSHQVLQYQGTGNRQLSGLEFYVDRFFAAEVGSAEVVEDFRRFLLALTRAPDDNLTAGPPRTLVIWPRLFVVECVLESVEFRYRRFGADGSPLVYTAAVTFEEILDVRKPASQAST